MDEFDRRVAEKMKSGELSFEQAAKAAFFEERKAKKAAEDAASAAAANIRLNAETLTNAQPSQWYAFTSCLPYMKLSCKEQAKVVQHNPKQV